MPIAVLTPAANYYIYADQLNTPRAVTNISNTVIWQWLGDPFGTTLADTDPDNDGVNFNFNLRFAGQYYDAESGLHYNYFRDYNPSTGRYIEPDPIGLKGGINLYGYVGGNPVNHFDFWGLLSSCSGCHDGSGLFKDLMDRYNPEPPDSYKSTSTENGDNCPISDTRPGKKTRGPTDQREKDGNIDTANDDFDNLNLPDVRDIPGVGRTGTLSDGRTVIIRPNSSDGRPTIEIQDGRSRIKVRYGD